MKCYRFWNKNKQVKEFDEYGYYKSRFLVFSSNMYKSEIDQKQILNNEYLYRKKNSRREL